MTRAATDAHVIALQAGHDGLPITFAEHLADGLLSRRPYPQRSRVLPQQAARIADGRQLAREKSG